MAKIKTTYVCNSCGANYPRWMGKCESCGNWNTLVEEVVATGPGRASSSGREIPVKKISEINAKDSDRIGSSIKELDQVLGGGIVPGSLILLGGDPGIGKSTLILQVASRIKNVLYFSGEESDRQIQMRAKRLESGDDILFASETNIENIISTINSQSPGVVIIDSIQTMYSGDIQGAAGNVSQLSLCTSKLMYVAKEKHVAIVLIGHVTKEGNIAGPRVLEHLVDVVLYLEGDRFGSFRILRGVKNRFGSTNEVGIFEMTASGLVEVTNPSEIMIGERAQKSPGSVIFPAIEGTRPLLTEVQALSSPTSFGYPKRTSSGFDLNRLQLLAAVLQKRCGLNLSSQDIYLNVAGGIKITEPAADLAVALSIASVYKNKAVKDDTIIFGEIGLAGEVRSVNNIDKRLAEAKKLGFKTAVLPKSRGKVGDPSNLRGIKDINIIEVASVKEAIEKVAI
jgi:DNA repair protein RadA/Sms